MNVRVRFAPSPTGHVHIGNIRAAIFNWLFARHESGKFLLRIEDTDAERSTEEAKRTLLDAMEWLGLNYDEPVVHQSERTAQHIDAALRMEREGRAYRQSVDGAATAPLVFRIPFHTDGLSCVRQAGRISLPVCSNVPVFVDHTGVKYTMVNRKGVDVKAEACLAGFMDLRLLDADGKCLFELAGNVDGMLRGSPVQSVPNVAKLEYTRREVFFKDLVKGELSKPLDDMKDLVIIRANGAPVFHMANVCDDIAQGITHVIRGDDHVENTYRHLFLFHALGAEPPRYGHLPMIVNQQGKPYSKRDGDAYVGDFRAKGFLPEALFNYLSLLGWSPGDNVEKMARQDAVRMFTLERVKNGAAQMDLKKLTHLNWQYVSELPLESFVRIAGDRLAPEPWMAGASGGELFRSVCALMQSRTTTLADTAGWKYFLTESVEFDEKEAPKLLQKEGVRDALKDLEGGLASTDFTVPGIEAAIRGVEKKRGIPEGKLNQPARVAVTGITRGAGLYETMALIGRERSIQRLRKAREKFCV